jgi:hypothetical protein
MDYELGTTKLPWQYWEALKEGKPYALPRTDTTLFSPIKEALDSAWQKNEEQEN